MLITLTRAPERPDAVASEACGRANFDPALRESVDFGKGDRLKGDSVPATSRPVPRPHGKGLLARVCEAVYRSRMAEAERRIAYYRRLLVDAGEPTKSGRVVAFTPDRQALRAQTKGAGRARRGY